MSTFSKGEKVSFDMKKQGFAPHWASQNEEKMRATIKYFFIKHNHNIGGRYSIFSEVCMVPAYLMGLNPYKIKKKWY